MNTLSLWAALGVLLDHRLAVGLAAVVDPARDVAPGIGIDDIVVVEGEQEGMAVLVLVAVLLVHLVVGAQRALVTDDALALFDGFGGEHAVAVDGRQTGGDLLFRHCVVPGDGRKWGIMAHPARATRPGTPVRLRKCPARARSSTPPCPGRNPPQTTPPGPPPP